MGLFGKLFSRDPTAEWPPHEGRIPPFDPAIGTFGPIRLGDPFERVRALGRPRTMHGGTRAGRLTYASGFDVDVEDGRFVGITYYMAPNLSGQPDLAPAEGSVGGLPVSKATTVDNLVGWLGDPGDREDDEDYLGLTYKRGKTTLYFEFTPEGLLEMIDVTLDD